MKLISGKIVAGERLKNGGFTFSIDTEDINAEIVVGAAVCTLSMDDFDKIDLRNLLKYLEDRPSLMIDFEVLNGIDVLKKLLK